MAETNSNPTASNPTAGENTVSQKIELLVGPRRSLAAKTMGIKPLSSGSMNSAISAMQRQQGIEIVREIKQTRKLKTLSTADEATTVVKVRTDVDGAIALAQSAPPNMTVELDALLSYGQAGASSLLETILSRQLGAVPKTQQVLLRIVGPRGEPISGAQVILEGSGFPQEGQTDSKGEVALSVYAATGSATLRSLFVRPGKDYWNRYISSPSLTTASVNVVNVKSLGEVVHGFPDTEEHGWGQKYMGLDQLPDEYTGKGVKIAIIDSGADNAHPILKHIKNGIDLTNNGDAKSWGEDVVGHGSHCAGIITGKGKGFIRGFAPDAEILVLKVFPGGQFSSLADALSHCIEQGIDVVNMSLGSSESSDVIEQQLDDAVQNGVACIVAAGNSSGPVQYPARSRNVMAVAALGVLNEFPADSWENQTVSSGMVTPEGVFSPSFTCFGPEIALAAPGVGIVSTVPGKGFDSQSGTSMAAPHVTGLAALLLAHHALFKTSLRERNANRVAGLFHLIKSMCTPLALGAERSGAGAPKMFNLGRVFDAAKTVDSASTEQGAQPAAAGPGLAAASATPFQMHGATAGLGSLLPFQAGPQFAPQGFFGDLISRAAPALGGMVGGTPGQVISSVGGLGSFLPFQAGPQFAPQGFGGALGSAFGGMSAPADGLFGGLGSFAPLQGGPTQGSIASAFPQYVTYIDPRFGLTVSRWN